MDGGARGSTTSLNMKLNGVVTEFDGELPIAGGSPMGRELIELGFELPSCSDTRTSCSSWTLGMTHSPDPIAAFAGAAWT